MKDTIARALDRANAFGVAEELIELLQHRPSLKRRNSFGGGWDDCEGPSVCDKYDAIADKVAELKSAIEEARQS